MQRYILKGRKVTTQWSGIQIPSAAAQSMPQDSHSQDASEWHQCSRNKEDRQEKCHSILGKMDILDIKECGKVELSVWKAVYQTNAIVVMFTSGKTDLREKKTTGKKEDYHIKI